MFMAGVKRVCSECQIGFFSNFAYFPFTDRPVRADFGVKKDTQRQCDSEAATVILKGTDI